MKNPNRYKLMLGKKDNVLKEWFQLLRDSDRNVSQIVSYALLYFIKNQSFAKLGNVDTQGKTYSDSVAKLIYVSNKEVMNWMEETSKTQRLNTVIKMILVSGIEDQHGKEPFAVSESDLFRMIYSKEENSEDKSPPNNKPYAADNSIQKKNEPDETVAREVAESDEDELMQQLFRAMLPEESSGLGIK